MAEGFVRESMIGRACASGLVDIRLHNLRDWATDRHRTTDDRPFGGGAGMLLKPEPVFAAVESLRREQTQVLYLCPDGEPFNTRCARELAGQPHLILLSGHYEGLDERVRTTLVHREISIGDYVLTNGTLAAAVVVDALCRYIPGVLGEEKSLTQDSFSDNLLSFPQFTRPAEFRGMKVPEVLLGGDHQAIAAWRREQQLLRTRQRRPDLLSKHPPSHDASNH